VQGEDRRNIQKDGKGLMGNQMRNSKMIRRMRLQDVLSQKRMGYRSLRAGKPKGTY